ncbi:MAG: translocation/assembly module TamB domain-containing protein [Legionella sp.]|nr:translocation/assembly module TamB domain-containing protein [Legionella sp.]
MQINFKFHLIRALLLRFGLLLIFLFGILTFLISTTPGLKLTLRIANLLLPGTLTTQQLNGKLLQHLAFGTLTYTHQKQSITLKNMHLKWHVSSYYPFNIMLETLEINQLKLTDNKNQTALDTIKFSGDFKAFTGYFNFKNNKITLKGPLYGPWHIHADLAGLDNLKSKLTADATVYDMQHAVLTAHLTKGSYQLPKDSMLERIDFKSASIKANLTPEALVLNAYGQLDDNISSRIQLKLPDIRLDKAPPKTQVISGQAQLFVSSLAFLDKLAKQSELGLMLQKPNGEINALIHISGVLNKPKLIGHITLENGTLTLPTLGVTLNPISANFKTDGTTFESHAQIQSNHGKPLILNAKGTITPDLTGSAVLSGEEVILMDTPEYYVTASPNLLLTAKPNAYQIDGSLLIPKARIAPVSFIHVKKLTHDAVLLDEEKSNPNPFNLTTNIALHMGQDITIDVKGIQGHIDGMLNIKQQPKQALTADGELKLRDGFYEAYGQKLNIEQGELIFMGQQIDNPNIRVRATRNFKQTNAQFSGSNQLFDFSAENLDTPNLGNNTTVGITASGRVDSPKVKLFSSPPNLSQADILSMLLLGKPVDHASKSGGKILLQAITAMNLNSNGKGVKMIQDLQKATGIDVDVQNSSLGTESSDFSKTSVSVGKSITKRVYLQYSVGLFQENSNVFTLTYLLNKFLSLKVTASDIGNGIDFTYTHSD